MANIGTLSVSLTARTDEYERKMKASRAAVRDFGTEAANSAKRGGDALEGLGRKGGVSFEALSKGSRSAVAGILELGGAAGRTAGPVGGLIGNLVQGFGQGGMIGLGISAVTGLIGLLGQESERAREAERKAAEERQRAAEKAQADAERAREAAAQRAKAQAEYQDNLRREIELLNARSESERRSIENAHKLADARERGGAAGAALERERQAAEEQKRYRDEAAKADEDAAKRREAAARQAEQAAQAQAERERDVREQLRKQVEERLRIASLTEEQKKHAQDLGLIEKARAAGLKQEADALEGYVKQLLEAEKATKARTEAEKLLEQARKAAEHAQGEVDKQKKADEDKKQARADYIAQLRESLLLAQAETEEKKKQIEREHELAVARMKGGKEAEDLVKQKHQADDKAEARAKAPRQADSGPPSTNLEDYDPASGVGPNTWLREQKKARRKYEKNKRNLANLKAEKRSRATMGEGEEGLWEWGLTGGEGGFDYEAKRKKKKAEQKKQEAAAAAQAAVVQGAAAADVRQEGGTPQYGGPTDFRPTTPSGGGQAPADNRGAEDAAKNLEEAIKKHEEAMAKAGEALKGAATAAQEGAPKAEEAAKGAEDLVKSLEEQSKALTDLASALGEKGGKEVQVLQELAKKLQDQAQELKKQKEQLDAIQKMVSGS